MKIFFVMMVVVFLALESYSQMPSVKVGGGLALGEWASVSDNWEESWGAGANIRLVLAGESSRFAISPSYIFFPVGKFTIEDSYFSTSTSIEVNPQMHYFNLDARYSFLKKDRINAYAKLGPSFLLYKEEWSASNDFLGGSGDNNEMKYGALAGLGFSIHLSSSMEWYLDACYSYIADDWDQTLITTGLLFRVF